uniref:Uncharacterized protein n=1 Tax=Nelumbo nucifera TaxID=4432 RepID=A0A822YUR1_NELNU|nr:TPA_asm: hypothetical protein HUJ06_011829 [Nelumbo nucifera]
MEESRINQLESTMESLASRQEQLRKEMHEMLANMNQCLEQLTLNPSQEPGESSNNRVTSGKGSRHKGLNQPLQTPPSPLNWQSWISQGTTGTSTQRVGSAELSSSSRCKEPKSMRKFNLLPTI